METLKFDVQGMTCDGCTGSVKRAISNLDGVGTVEVTLRPGTAIVQSDPARVTADQIESAIAKLGYQAQARPANAI